MFLLGAWNTSHHLKGRTGRRNSAGYFPSAWFACLNQLLALVFSSLLMKHRHCVCFSAWVVTALNLQENIIRLGSLSPLSLDAGCFLANHWCGWTVTQCVHRDPIVNLPHHTWILLYSVPQDSQRRCRRVTLQWNDAFYVSGLQLLEKHFSDWTLCDQNYKSPVQCQLIPFTDRDPQIPRGWAAVSLREREV